MCAATPRTRNPAPRAHHQKAARFDVAELLEIAAMKGVAAAVAALPAAGAAVEAVPPAADGEAVPPDEPAPPSPHSDASHPPEPESEDEAVPASDAEADAVADVEECEAALGASARQALHPLYSLWPETSAAALVSGARALPK